MIDYKKQGKANKRKGAAFEVEVRKNLESEGWIVFKNHNKVEVASVDPEDGIGGEFVPSKPKFNPFTRSLMYTGSGFPDFLMVKRGLYDTFDVKFVECKLGKYLDADEKNQVQWIKDNLHIDVIRAYKKDKEVIYEQL